mmetsp:Transcript_23132/g.41063  ORF Transcript_23132/g.41063 Transcript_23132/m.41063 type:complete len:360 (+) Transcript_23132:414-1493(+)
MRCYPRVVHCLHGGGSLGGVPLQQELDELHGLRAPALPHVRGERNWVGSADVLHCRGRRNGGARPPPGIAVGHHTVQHDSGAPHVRLDAVVLVENLWCKVLVRAATLRQMPALRHSLAASKVDYPHREVTGRCVGKHEIGRFDVSEANSYVMRFGQELKDDSGYNCEVVLRNVAPVLLHVVLKAATLEVVHNKIHVTLVLELVSQMNNGRAELHVLQQARFLRQVALHLGGCAALASFGNPLHRHQVARNIVQREVHCPVATAAEHTLRLKPLPVENAPAQSEKVLVYLHIDAVQARRVARALVHFVIQQLGVATQVRKRQLLPSRPPTRNSRRDCGCNTYRSGLSRNIVVLQRGVLEM